MIDRYQTKEMSRIFSDDAKMDAWLLVERVVASVQEQAGIIPRGLSGRMKKVRVSPERMRQIEEVTHHDVIAFLTAAREQLGNAGRWMHYGLTSYDLVDTAFALSLQKACTIIITEIKKLENILVTLSLKHRDTPQIGRTHGMFAQPISFGYKVRSWHEEVKRARSRLETCRKEISFGKLSGAVGTYTMLPRSVEKKVMKKLGLMPEPVSTQVIPRDRHASLMNSLALHACALERLATEIRNLSRTEIAEVREPFGRGQKGSSAMPHKKNPITCERVCGLARVVRSYVIPAYENINLWHERDITNSSVERVIIPDAFHLTHYCTLKMTWVMKSLDVFPERMLENIQKSCGVYASQHLMNSLIERGMSRDDAYQRVQQLSFRAVQTQRQLKDLVHDEPAIRKLLTQGEIEKIFDLKWFLRHITR
jgi:adenylosuccinate lyase